MGISIPQVITSDRASGAQVIDGSLKFDDNYLTRTPGSGGNHKSWTWSAWVKPDRVSGNLQNIFEAKSDGSNYDAIYFTSGQALEYELYRSSQQAVKITNRVFRDTGWYHLVVVYDSQNSTADDRVRIYVNGERETSFSSSTNPDTTDNSWVNDNGIVHQIGDGQASNQEYDGRLSQVYLIDGASLEPENFGFTDPLTNTWKPKKYKHDKRFYGVTFSNQLSPSDGPWRDSNPKSNGFDGSAATSIALDTVEGTLTFSPNFGQGPFEIEYKGFNDGQTTASIDGTALTYTSGSIWTGAVNTFNTLTLVAAANNRPGISYIKVNGYILVDAAADNSFYLPFDGNTPIGRDQIGNGNDYTPVNFGGSVALDNPQVSGAKPILNTTQGGTQAGVGVFGSKENVVYTVTVASVDGGNRYHFDGVDRPTLSNLIRGVTYTFDQSDSSNGSHPLVFGSTAEGNNFRRGALYGSISPGNIGAATTITIPYDAPETLYYHCSSHSGMGGSIVGIHTDETKADQYASNCILALPLIGSTGDVSASIACTSSTKAITNNNATASNLRSNFYSGSFDFDSSADLRTASLADFAYGTGDFTWEAWFYHDTSNNNQYIIDHGNNSGTILYNSSGQIAYYVDSSQNASFGTIAQNKWHHVAVCRSSGVTNGFLDGKKTQLSANDTSNFGTAVVAIGEHGPGSYNWEGNIQDVRIYRGVAKYTTDFVVPSRSPDILPDTPSGVSGGSKLAKITDGAIALDGNGDYLTLTDSTDFDFGTGDYTAEAFVYARSHADMYVINQTTDHGGAAPWWGLNVWSNGSSFTIRAGRTDGSGNAKHEFSFPWAINKWYHFAVSRSSGTSRLYFDGRLLDTQSDTDDIDGNGSLYVGAYNDGSLAWNGFISNVRIVKGTGLYTKAKITPPTAPLTNVTNTKVLLCQSPTSAVAGFIPGFISANGDVAATNFNPFNTDIKTVRGQETGYCTWNPLNKGDAITLSNGNLQAASTSSPKDGVFGTIGVSSGKFYWEVKLLNATGNTNAAIGVARDTLSPDAGTPTSAGAYFYSSYNGNKWLNDTDSSYGDSYAASDTIGVALDLDNTTLTFFKNGVSQGDATTSLPSETFFPYVGDNANNASQTVLANWGQKPFSFPPPDGFQPLNAANVRLQNVISRPDQFVGVTTYKGSSGNVEVNNLNFKPDVVWIKQRNASGYTDNHVLIDTVRGRASSLYPDATFTPNTSDADRDLISFDRNGFTLGQTQQSAVNRGTSGNYVAWCWKAGGNKNTFNIDDEGFATAAAAGLDGGSINPTGASVGTKQGFSIIKADPSQAAVTISHGLGKKPAFIISKSLSQTYDWTCFHQSLGVSKTIRLNTGAEEQSVSNYWGSGMTTTTFGVASGNNANNQDMMYYLWADVPGLQKFGTYTGKSALNFVELGFRPALIMLKNASNSSYTSYTFFAMFDSVRKDNHNPMQNVLFAGKSQAENLRGNGGSMSSIADFSLDFLSNGFALRDNGASEINLSGDTYIYAAWAEAPTIDLFGGGANAR